MTAPSPTPAPVGSHAAASPAADGSAATRSATAPATAPAPTPTPAPEPVADRFASAVPVANPALVGLPAFLVGSIALALNLGNFAPQGAVGAPIAVIALGTGLGLLLATVYALKAGESAVAGVFGIFTGFWLSYAALVLGLLHNWFALDTAVAATVKTFVLAWLIVIGLLTVASVRLPSAFTLLFLLVDLALVFVLLAYVNIGAAGPDSGDLKVASGFAWAFIVVGAYLFLDAMTAATGGRNLPLGRAILT